MSGFVALHREAFDHPVLRDGDRFRAWFWLVSNACWKQSRVEVGGAIVTLERSQLCYSIRYLAEAWRWPKSNVDRFLKRLEAESMVTLTRSKTGTASGTAQIVVTICNYDKYQDSGNQTGTPDGTEVGQQRDSSGTNKNKGNKGIRLEEPNGSPNPPIPPEHPAKANPKSGKVAMTEGWQPAPLPPTVQVLVDLWPPGRLEREVDQFRDYWIDRGDRRPGWDRTFHNRIRDVHDRVLKDCRNGNGNHPHQPRDTRDAFQRVIDRELDGFAAERASREAGRHDDPDPPGLRLIGGGPA